jgi:hypothetical protein
MATQRNLNEVIDQFVTLHDRDASQEDYAAALSGLVISEAELTSLLLSGYRKVRASGAEADARRYLDKILAFFSPPAAFLLSLPASLETRGDEALIAALYDAYIAQGGLEIVAYDHLLYHYFVTNQYDRVMAVDALASERGLFKNLDEINVFNTAMMVYERRDLDRAFAYFKYLHEETSLHEDALKNLNRLAKIDLCAKAAEYLIRIRKKYFKDYMGDHSPAGTPFEFSLDDVRQQDSALALSLLSNGMCLVRGGCDVDGLAKILRYATSELVAQFPTFLNDHLLEMVQPILLFDAPKIMQRVLRYPATLDPACSILRKVSPGVAESFTPFHQDVTAFMKAVVNIWIPLTPAGGDYPSMQFVRKRISAVEPTETYDGEYNLVEIAQDVVLEKYQDQLYTLTDAQPGDCILFLGSTIHRSFNLEAATQDRYNLELRWS